MRETKRGPEAGMSEATQTLVEGLQSFPGLRRATGPSCPEASRPPKTIIEVNTMHGEESGASF